MHGPFDGREPEGGMDVQLFRADLFGDLLSMFITNTPWAWANQYRFFKSLKVLKIYPLVN